MSVESDLASGLADAAASLWRAESAREAIAPLSETLSGLAVEDAYLIQRSNIRRRLEAGERVVGRKIGLTSRAMQEQLGVDRPDYGAITDAMVIGDGATFDVGELIAPRVEAEFAFRIRADLPPSPTRAQLVEAIDGVAVALEIIDSRIADWRITLPDTVADNASSARIVCGAFVPVSAQLLAELPDTVLTLTKDGVDAGSGPGSAVLGDPLISLEWLAGAIGAYEDRFAAGDVVLAGAVAASVPLTPGSTWTAYADGYPPVTLRTASTAS